MGDVRGLHAACERADDDPAIKVVVLRGAGDKAFVAGTDIAQFEDFASGADGVAYEARFTRIIDRLENVDVPTVAAVGGACVGGGLAIAADATSGWRRVGAFRGADRSHPRRAACHRTACRSCCSTSTPRSRSTCCYGPSC
ncbi:MAG: enoyl-CoA hydratase-related protein [Nocardioidaceae bacterium]